MNRGPCYNQLKVGIDVSLCQPETLLKAVLSRMWRLTSRAFILLSLILKYGLVDDFLNGGTLPSTASKRALTIVSFVL